MSFTDVYAITANSLAAETFRQAPSSFIAGTGVVGSGDLAVSPQATPAMSVQVAAGQVWIPGTLSSTTGFPANLGAQTGYGLSADFNEQASYYLWNNGTVNVTISASDPTNPRIDLIVAYVQDAAYAGSNNQGVIGVVTGTPAASPSAPSAPSSAVVLAQVAVAAGATSITSGDITDERPVVAMLNPMVGNPAGRAVSTLQSTIPTSTVTLVGNMSSSVLKGGMTFASNAFTVPVDGLYLAVGQVSWSDSTAASYQTLLYHNGAAYPSGTFPGNYWTGTPSSNPRANIHVVDFIDCAAGDTIALAAWQNSGSSIATASTGLSNTFIEVALVSR